MATIKKWIHECTTNHRDCHFVASADRGWFPKRILDLRNNRIKLCNGLQECSIYACLSHCWGTGNSMIKTTVATIEQFKSNILWETLSKTFQDAVDICRRLGIHWLWIDSLCIIQDDEGDWKEVASKMAEIYENSFLTIAATTSRDGSGGCYATTRPELLDRHLSQGFYFGAQPPEFPAKSRKSPNSSKWPLFTRGWVYQELRLSHRVLHFCSREVIWQCRAERKSESGRNDQDFAKVNRLLYPEAPMDTSYSKLAEDPVLLWHITVEEYSRLQLTFQKDIMLALSALARRMETLRVDDRYMAGLWEKSLLHDLEWVVKPDRVTGRPEKLNRQAPSWSWASVQSEVFWLSHHHKSVLSSVEVKDICCITIGPSHMGEVSQASITLCGPFITATLIDPSHGSWDGEIASPILLMDRPDYKLLLSPDENSLIMELSVCSFMPDYDLNQPGQHCISPGSKVLILPLSVSIYEHRAILLRKYEGTSSFERIGCLEFQHRDIDILTKKTKLRSWGDPESEIQAETQAKNNARKGCKARVEEILKSLNLSIVTII
jgi:hypothetical protein